MHRIAADPQHRLWRATPVGLARFDGHQDLQAARDALQRLSPSDVLTRIDNRRHFQREFDQATVMSQRLAVPVALLLTDIDRFKAVKDRYGHLQGDACLPAVPRVLPSTVRVGEDTVARYAGEEFAVPLVSSSAATAGATAERIRAGVMALALPHAEAPSGLLTVSIGIAIAGPQGQSTDAETPVKRADQALCQAKAGGRNQMVLGSDAASARSAPSRQGRTGSALQGGRPRRPAVGAG